MKPHTWVFFVLIFLLYILTLRGIAGNPQIRDVASLEKIGSPFENSIERGRYILALSLLNNKSVAMPFKDVYAARPDIGVHEGKFYTLFTAGVSAAVIPLYLLGSLVQLGQVAAYMTVVLIAVFNSFMLYKMQRDMFGLSWAASLFGSVMFSLATNAWSYGITLYQHHFVTGCLLVSVYSVWRFGNSSKTTYAAQAAVSLGLCSFFDEISTVFTLPVIAYFFWKVKHTHRLPRMRAKIYVFVVSLAAVTIMHAVYNWALFGSAFKVTGMIARWREVEQLMIENNVGISEATRQELSVKKYGGILQISVVPAGLITLLLSPDRGLFIFSPILLYMIFGFAGIGRSAADKRRSEYVVCLSLALLVTIVYSAWGDAAGGWAFGPRYMIPAVAFIIPFVVRGIQAQLSEGTAAAMQAHFLLVALLAGYSTLVSSLGAVTTNLIPAQSYVEHINRGGYNFMLNLKYLGDGLSGSFFYNTWLAFIPLWLYLEILLCIAMSIQIYLLSRMAHK